jgi:alpha-D-ribose 1-methylphosphonate 5-triphosphate synthase subunit PhnH
MNHEDLQQVRPGFYDPSLGSQAVFRCALSALSHPGRVIEIPDVSERPRHGHGAAAILLQALIDSDCSVWLSPSLATTDAAAWLRFHTGCTWAESPSEANFLWITQGDSLPALSTLNAGTDDYPDQSATCVIEVSHLEKTKTQDTQTLSLSGPGIATEEKLSVQALPEDFVDQWAANHGLFPRGIDVFLASPTQLVGMPRTLGIGVNLEV